MEETETFTVASCLIEKMQGSVSHRLGGQRNSIWTVVETTALNKVIFGVYKGRKVIGLGQGQNPGKY